MPAGLKQMVSTQFLFFELGGITKHLMAGPARDSKVCFPSTTMFPKQTLRSQEDKFKLTVSLGTSH